MPMKNLPTSKPARAGSSARGTLAALALLAAPAAAQFGSDLPFGGSQQHAHGELFLRVEDNQVRAALQIEIDEGWHLYHDDKGTGVAEDTVVTPTGTSVTWGPVLFPAPHVESQPDFDDPKAPDKYVNVHYETIVLYAVGTLADGATTDDVAFELKGQTCEDGPFGVCVTYGETLTPSGAGEDALFDAFPLSLLPDDRRGDMADATLYTRERDGKILAAITVDIADAWHLYHADKGPGTGKPTRVTLGGEGITWGEVAWPEPEKYEALGEWTWVHHGDITLYAEGTLAEGVENAQATASLDGLTCSSGPDGTCIPYRETAYPRGEGDDALFEGFDEAFLVAARGLPHDDAEGGAAATEEEQTSLGAFLALAVFWGLFTLLMPCTYPMIPITISFFTKQADARGGNVLPLSMTYGAGIVGIFILIGVAFGSVIIPFATNPWTNIIIAGFFILFALALFGVVNLNPPRFLMNAAGKASMTGGYLGVFLMGACLVVTSFTCTAPFVGSLLSVGAVDGNLTRIVLGMGTFGATMAIPFVLLSLVPGRLAAMPQSGQWMNTLKVTLGFVEIAAAMKFLSNADLVWHWEILSRELFLFLWAAIFLAAAVYLIAFAGGKGFQPASGRTLAGLALAGLAFYSLYGGLGNGMDKVMTAIIPNYSGGRFTPALFTTGVEHTIVVDDYDEALRVAREEQKMLLVNFTGHT